MLEQIPEPIRAYMEDTPGAKRYTPVYQLRFSRDPRDVVRCCDRLIPAALMWPESDGRRYAYPALVEHHGGGPFAKTRGLEKDEAKLRLFDREVEILPPGVADQPWNRRKVNFFSYILERRGTLEGAWVEMCRLYYADDVGSADPDDLHWGGWTNDGQFPKWMGEIKEYKYAGGARSLPIIECTVKLGEFSLGDRANFDLERDCQAVFGKFGCGYNADRRGGIGRPRPLFEGGAQGGSAGSVVFGPGAAGLDRVQPGHWAWNGRSKGLGKVLSVDLSSGTVAVDRWGILRLDGTWAPWPAPDPGPDQLPLYVEDPNSPPGAGDPFVVGPPYLGCGNTVPECGDRGLLGPGPFTRTDSLPLVPLSWHFGLGEGGAERLASGKEELNDFRDTSPAGSKSGIVGKPIRRWVGTCRLFEMDSLGSAEADQSDPDKLRFYHLLVLLAHGPMAYLDKSSIRWKGLQVDDGARRGPGDDIQLFGFENQALSSVGNNQQWATAGFLTQGQRLALEGQRAFWGLNSGRAGDGYTITLPDGEERSVPHLFNTDPATGRKGVVVPRSQIAMAYLRFDVGRTGGELPSEGPTGLTATALTRLPPGHAPMADLLRPLPIRARSGIPAGWTHAPSPIAATYDYLLAMSALHAGLFNDALNAAESEECYAPAPITRSSRPGIESEIVAVQSQNPARIEVPDHDPDDDDFWRRQEDRFVYITLGGGAGATIRRKIETAVLTSTVGQAPVEGGVEESRKWTLFLDDPFTAAEGLPDLGYCTDASQAYEIARLTLMEEGGALPAPYRMGKLTVKVKNTSPACRSIPVKTVWRCRFKRAHNVGKFRVLDKKDDEYNGTTTLIGMPRSTRLATPPMSKPTDKFSSEKGMAGNNAINNINKRAFAIAHTFPPAFFNF